MPHDPSVDEACDWLDSIADGALDLTRDGLGERLLRNQAARIADRAGHEEGSEGPWDANKGDYGKAKRQRSVKVGVGLRRKRDNRVRMLDADQLAGKPNVKPGSAELTYGKTARTRTRMEWFENGSTGTDGQKSGAKGQPPRPTWEFSDSDQEALSNEVDDAVRSFLDSL